MIFLYRMGLVFIVFCANDTKPINLSAEQTDMLIKP